MAVWPKNKNLAVCKFVALLLETADLKSSGVISGQVQPQITRTSLSPLSCLLPPLEEQKRIVDVVSSVDACIDALQQQADTARTARNAVLHELLSAGGDDWTEIALGEIADFVRGPFGGSLKKEIFVPEGFAVYEQQHAIYGDFGDFRYFVNQKKFDEMKRFSVSPGDLLMSCSGTIGKVALVPAVAPVGIINQALLKISTSSQVLAEFLLYWTQSEIFRLLIAENSGGAVQQNVASVKLLKDIKINLPSLTKQKRIVEIVSSMDDVIQSTEQAVADAKNLRSGLLSDLLSGEHEIPAPYDVFVGAA
jgi:type I restriction enzyme S subunit